MRFVFYSRDTRSFLALSVLVAAVYISLSSASSSRASKSNSVPSSDSPRARSSARTRATAGSSSSPCASGSCPAAVPDCACPSAPTIPKSLCLGAEPTKDKVCYAAPVVEPKRTDCPACPDSQVMSSSARLNGVPAGVSLLLPLSIPRVPAASTWVSDIKRSMGCP